MAACFCILHTPRLDQLLLLYICAYWLDMQYVLEFPVCPLTLKGTSAVKAIMHVMSWCSALNFITGSAGTCVTSGGIT